MKFDKVRRHLEFKTQKLAPMTYVIDRCTDYPYKSWYLRCVGPDKALLDICTKRNTTFVFEITPGEVKLIEKADPELAHIVNKPFPPGMILEQLLASGINLMPRNEDAQLCGYTAKDRGAEERAILELATSVNGFAFRASTRNHAISSGILYLKKIVDKVAVGVRVNPEYDREFFEKDEGEWKTFVWYENKCGLTKLKDSNPESLPELQDSCVVHLIS